MANNWNFVRNFPAWVPLANRREIVMQSGGIPSLTFGP